MLSDTVTVVAKVALVALVAFVTVVPAITVANAVPFTVIASASNVPSTSTSPEISKLGAVILPLNIAFPFAEPSRRNAVKGAPLWENPIEKSLSFSCTSKRGPLPSKVKRMLDAPSYLINISLPAASRTISPPASRVISPELSISAIIGVVIVGAVSVLFVRVSVAEVSDIVPDASGKLIALSAVGSITLIKVS